MKTHLATVFSVSILALMPACSQEARHQLDVPFVPTPQKVVDAMLDMVDLQDGDVVWDLGSGDGRMVITAAKRKDIRGVGVDLDPKRVEESRANAKEAGVEDCVTFRVADLFKTDFSDATVLTMYLLQSVNIKLRPVILNDLQPGARIVSNSFTMGDWTPDATQKTDVNSLSRTIYHWVVPANISGVWDWEMADTKGSLTIDQQFQKFSGNATIEGIKHEFKEGNIHGKEIAFVVTIPNRDQETYSATAEGETMTGTIDGKTWQATRRADTRKPIDPNGLATAGAR
ncbi:MAG: class I SAM-dependent methyltransferase [Akkermansiaceae bacterium]